MKESCSAVSGGSRVLATAGVCGSGGVSRGRMVGGVSGISGHGTQYSKPPFQPQDPALHSAASGGRRSVD